MKCMICGAELPLGTQYCDYCGAPLAAQQEMQVPGEQPMQTAEQPAQQSQPAQQPEYMQVQPNQVVQQNQPVPQAQYQPVQPNQQAQQTQPMQQRQPIQQNQPHYSPVQQYQPVPPVQPSRGPETPSPNKGGGSKKKLIIGLSIAGTALIAGVIILIIMLNKGDKTEPTQANASTEIVTTETVTAVPTTEIVTTEEPITEKPTTEAVTTEEPTTEQPEPVPYFEENALTFSPADTKVTQNGYMYFVNYYESLEDPNAKPIDDPGLIPERSEYTSHIDKVLVSDPDTAGNVNYTIEVNMDFMGDFRDKTDGVEWSILNGMITPIFFDYTTGYKMEFYNIVDGIDNQKNKVIYDIPVKDKTIHVEGIFSEEHRTDYFDFEDSTDGSRYHETSYTKILFFITAPQDYDGLCMALYGGSVDKELYHSYMWSDKSFKELYTAPDGNPYHLFDKDSFGYQVKPEDLKFFKVSDLAVSETPALKADLLSCFGTPILDHFNWVKEEMIYQPTGQQVMNAEEITGRWEGYIIWDFRREFDSYGVSLVDANFELVDTNRIIMSYDYPWTKMGEDGEWQQPVDNVDESIPGYFVSNGSISVDSDETGRDFRINGIYTDGVIQYAVGVSYTDYGAMNYIFLYRP
ncbi:MAG: zinc ribbon domain-containing protein [Eubacterium sp.]|nr:zinc ribbon domain-containing protein [Eubacterium sp.]